MTSDRKAHWETIYSTKGEAEVSWFQETPTPSLELLALVGARPTSAIAVSAAARHGWSTACSRQASSKSP